MSRTFTVLVLTATNILVAGHVTDELETLPYITEEISNLTVVAGREAILSCHVSHLGSYKVAWVRVDTQTILTIHNSIITRNQRVSLSHREHKEWKLHISSVQELDRGWYMCQVNTDPMRSKRGYLEVTVPPSIVDQRSSTDLVVREKDEVNMTCEARGYPIPKVIWRREDGAKMLVKGRGKSMTGKSLVFESVGRAHIGTYLCIASNGVPPSVSKRVQLRVQFPPMMSVPSQLERARLGGNATLRCRSEAYPASINYWINKDSGIVNTDSNHKVSLDIIDHITNMKLEIFNVQQSDFGVYECVSKNSLGETDGKIRLNRMTDGNEVEDKSTTISTKSSKQSTLPAYYNYPKSKNDWLRNEILKIGNMEPDNPETESQKRQNSGLPYAGFSSEGHRPHLSVITLCSYWTLFILIMI